MKCRFWFAALALVVNVWAGTPPVRAQGAAAGKIRAVVSEGEAYLPGPVQMVTPAQTKNVIIHPQGRYALVVQNEAALSREPGVVGVAETGTVTLLLYDARLNKTRTLWEQNAGGAVASADITEVSWLPGTDCAVALARTLPPDATKEYDATYTLLFFDFRKSLAARTLYTGLSHIDLRVSPHKPLVLAEFWGGPPGANRDDPPRICFITARGVFGASLPKTPHFMFHWWNESGTAVHRSEVIPNPDPNAPDKYKAQYSEWNAETGAVTPLSTRPSFASHESPVSILPFTAKTTPLSVPPRTKNDAATFHPLYLEANNIAPANAPYSSLLIAPDADKSYLLADESAVLYESQGALYAVPLMRKKAAAFALAQKAAYRLAAGDYANQVGKAILAHAADHDEMLPPQAGFADAIKPYLKNMDILNGFTYVGGGSHSTIKSPDTTALGYLSAPGGRVVVYADGHVKWEEKP